MFHCVKNDEMQHTTSVLWFNTSLNCTGPYNQISYQSRSSICRSDDDNYYYYAGDLTEGEDDGSRMTCTTDFEPWKLSQDAAVFL